MAQDEVFIYALSSCPWCRRTKQWFADSRVPFESVDVDTLPEEDQDAAAEKAYRLSGGRRFPVVIINGEVIVGHNPDKFLKHLHGAGW